MSFVMNIIQKLKHLQKRIILDVHEGKHVYITSLYFFILIWMVVHKRGHVLCDVLDPSSTFQSGTELVNVHLVETCVMKEWK